MEAVLDVYQRSPDPARPRVCLDETSGQLLGETRPPLTVRPGYPAWHNAEDVRGGVIYCFLVTVPLLGWRQVRVSTQRTRIDLAHCVRGLVDVHVPEAEQIVLFIIHSPASLSQPFLPAEAKRIADKLDIHHTPKQGS